MFKIILLVAGIYADSLTLPRAIEKARIEQRIKTDPTFAFDQVISDFSDRSISRKDLLKRFEAIAKNHPGSKFTAQVEDAIAKLKKMIAEDEAHSKKRAHFKSDLVKKERIAELIYQLRDQNGHQYSFPGFCDIFQEGIGHRRDGKTPAHQLVALGYDAIPQLIDLLNDDRFTRSTESTRGETTLANVLRVGNCAAIILNRIAGRSVCHEFVKIGKSSEGVAENQKLANDWWKEFQEKGEKRMLVEGTEMGNSDSCEQAERLVAKYPNEALQAVIRGAHRAEDSYIRSQLIRSAEDLKGEQVLDFLTAELKGPFQRSRLAAAKGLFKAGRDNGVDVMIQNWKDRVKDKDDDQRWGRSEIIEFLVSTGKPQAIQALREGYNKVEADERMDIIRALRTERTYQSKPFSRETRNAMDQVLIEALGDTERRWNCTIGNSRNNLEGPRLCDLAADALVENWERPKLFDMFGPLQDRSRQVIEVKNVWLKRQGKAPMPLPPKKKTNPLPDTTILPLIHAFCHAANPDDRAKAAKPIESLGLQALPAVLTSLKKIKESDPGYLEIRTLAARLTFFVDEVHFTLASAEPDKKLRELLDGMVHKPVSGSAIAALMYSVTQNPPKGIRGIQLAVERLPDNQGAFVEVTLLTGVTEGENWHTGLEIKVADSHKFRSVFGPAEDEEQLQKLIGEWTKFWDELEEVVQTAPGKAVSIHVECVKAQKPPEINKKAG